MTLTAHDGLRRAESEAALLEAHVARVVANWPPLTPDQLARVGALLAPAGGASI